mmetsp:Transcript_49673/g.121972  ORF Transcript_49673/g.121972 Transcript_49673/m.121972 type:complete len:236 (-) Transcript_49673:123-830(-)
MQFYPRDYVPKKYVARRSYFWWVAQLMHVLWQPTARVRAAQVEARRWLREQLGDSNNNFMGVQIRHGDKCNLGALDKGCHPVSHFLAQMQRVRSTYPTLTAAFVATDSDVALAELRDLNGKLDRPFKIVARQWNRTALTTLETTATAQYGMDACHASGACDVLDSYHSLMVDVRLLLDASAYVFSFTSNVNRLVYELSYAERHCYVPFVSLDIAWCHNGGRARGGTWDRWRNHPC